MAVLAYFYWVSGFQKLVTTGPAEGNKTGWQGRPEGAWYMAVTTHEALQ